MTVAWKDYVWAQPCPPKPDEIGSLELIIRSDEQQRAYSIADTYTQVKPHVPIGIYPFAVTGTGDYICFDYRGSPHAPKIVFYFSESAHEEALYPLAQNFSGLLAKLHD